MTDLLVIRLGAITGNQTLKCPDGSVVERNHAGAVMVFRGLVFSSRARFAC